MTSPIPDTEQLPVETWQAIIRDVRGGMTEAILISSRYGVSEARAEGLIRTVQMMPQPNSRSPRMMKRRQR